MCYTLKITAEKTKVKFLNMRTIISQFGEYSIIFNLEVDNA